MRIWAKYEDRCFYAIGDCDAAPNKLFLAYYRIEEGQHFETEEYVVFEDVNLKLESRLEVIDADALEVFQIEIK